MTIVELLQSPEAWVALATLIAMEVVLGIDNLLFISIVTNKLPEEKRRRARNIGIGGALVMRLGLLSIIAWIVTLTQPVFEAFGQELSWKDLILIAGGLFLLWKGTKEIHEQVDPKPIHDARDTAMLTVGVAVAQILVLDLVFSIDSIITAVGMTEHLPIMIAAVLVAVISMLIAAGTLARFVDANPTVVMLALSFLMMIGMTLVAEGFGVKVPKGYVYAAMAFSALVEALNVFARRARRRKEARRADIAVTAGGYPPYQA